jgi:predicted esterase
VRDDDPDQAWRSQLVAESRRLAATAARGDDAFGAVKGYARVAFFSKLDGTPQPYELFVPPAYRAEKRWPLVVTLHGFKGNAGDYFRNTFGLARDAADGESLEGHGRHGEAPTKGPMIVIAPTGRGQAMYRHAGEVDVLEAIDDARRRFNVDPDRIYVTGGSMGGTGAAYLPYRNPDLFAAAAALAGYHDQRVRADTDHARLSKAERFLQAERSDVDWAENGLHLPTLLVRGTKDVPLEWTRSLARRLKELGYRFEHREPELGHNVWSETYAEGAIFRYFAPFKRPAAPREVRLRTARERTSRAWWVSIDERAAPDAFADVDARVGADGLVTVRTDGVTTLTLSPGEELLPAGQPLRVEIDGQRLEGPRPLSLRRAAGGPWEALPPGAPPTRPGRKRAGLSGPIRDVYHDPLLFVVGTQDPDHTLINRLVARAWARPEGWLVSYPIVDDADVTEEMIRTHTLVLVGPPRSNLLVRRWAARLPVRFEEGAVVLGGRRHAGPQVGAAFVAPNPDAPDRALLVLAGPGPLGTWRALCLPDILPDYVIYDERIAPARGGWSIGGAGADALEAGFFGMDWSVP